MTDEEWARVAPWLDAALDFMPVRTHGLSDVRAAIECGDAQLWAGRKCAVVTQLEIHPLVTALSVWLAGGDLIEIRDEIQPVAEAWARARGCRFIVATGRQGWGRALGYKPIHWTCAKELI